MSRARDILSRRPRGLTLFEILIAIVILMAVTTLVLPPVIQTLRRTQFDAAADVLIDQLRLARAHAQLNGQAIEVVYHRDLGAIEARVFDPDNVEFIARQYDITFEDEAADTPTTLEAPDDELEISPDATISEAWAIRRLDAGLTLTWTAPESDVDQPAGSLPMMPAAMEAVEAPMSRLVVFLSDGSALLARPVWLADDDGRVGEVVVNPWTGSVVIGPPVAADSELTTDAGDEIDEDLDIDPAMDEEDLEGGL